VAFRDGRLLDVTGTVRYEIIGKGVRCPLQLNHSISRREAGPRGDYKKAIALLERASELAPEWPYPVYDRAYTHLLLNDFDAARTYYRRTLELSPRGFWTAITALAWIIHDFTGEKRKGALKD
jgi:tetratricopeptide (TPR) repeat protein